MKRFVGMTILAGFLVGCTAQQIQLMNAIIDFGVKVAPLIALLAKSPTLGTVASQMASYETCTISVADTALLNMTVSGVADATANFETCGLPPLVAGLSADQQATWGEFVTSIQAFLRAFPQAAPAPAGFVHIPGFGKGPGHKLSQGELAKVAALRSRIAQIEGQLPH